VSVSDARTGVSWDAASITINDLAGTFVTGSAEDQVVTLLHELAHAMNYIFGAGTNPILPDGTDVPDGINKSILNANTVDAGCWPPPTFILNQ
jgi:hypothetical protein